MSVGYEGIALGVKEIDFISISEENSSKDKQIEGIAHNLRAFDKILDYNIINHIGFYSIDPKLIPSGWRELGILPWWESFESELHKLGEKINKAKIRICMEPVRANILSSMKEEDYTEAIKELEHYAKIFKALKLGTEHKIILQIGSTDEGKTADLEKFKTIFNGLDKTIFERLAIGNKESQKNTHEIIKLGKTLGLPVVCHIRHHEMNPSTSWNEELEGINECKKTWKESDGKQIISYTALNEENQIDSLAETIKIKTFLAFYGKLDSNFDIRLEVKDRNLSAVKCLNCIQENKDIKALELEWRRYKYSVLENSHAAYLQIRSLLKEKDKYPVVEFYTLIEDALEGKKRKGFVNAAQHVWGYFKKCATEDEKKDFLMRMEEYKSDRIEMEEIKKSLWKLSVKYNIKYLLESYYFIL